MRDPLTPYGAPAIDDSTLGAAWNQLDSWARSKERVSPATSARLASRRPAAKPEYQAALDALSDALIRAELSPPGLGLRPANSTPP